MQIFFKCTFISETANVFNAPCTSTIVSLVAKASNLLGAVTNGKLVSSAIFAAAFSAKPFGAFNPVPTAVPPSANSYNLGRVSFTLLIPLHTCAA